MNLLKQTTISRDDVNLKLLIEREFEAPLDLVWKAWTDSNLLDLWWAPRPWKAKTKSMDFKEGGTWLYSMIGPDGSEIFCRLDYEKIVPNKRFIATDAFCDENGNTTETFPNMHWKNEFRADGESTKVIIEISFKTVEDMDKIIEMGFKEGFTAAHGNLDELLEKQMK
jgi:uncharacterized protein YndB with AHSA1/START domain